MGIIQASPEEVSDRLSPRGKLMRKGRGGIDRSITNLINDLHGLGS